MIPEVHGSSRSRACFSWIAGLLLLAPASVAAGVAGPTADSADKPCVAVLEAEVIAKMPSGERKALAGRLDTLLTESLARRKDFVTVDRQALDKVLAEKTAKAGGLTKIDPKDVAASLRPFWSAGILICPVVRQVETDRDKKPSKIPRLVIEIDAILAQTGQSLGEAHAIVTWRNRTWDKAPSLEAALNALWSDLPNGLRHAMANRHIEIADVRLTSSLRRLQWMADALGDALRASLARPGVALLRPRHPASTREERLLRVMGLSSPNSKAASATLACSPDFRLDVELSEKVGKVLDYDKTPITLSLSLQGQKGKPAKAAFSGKASQYTVLSQQASAWLNKQLAGTRSPTSEAQDREYSRKLARRELEAARQLEKLCAWYAEGWNTSGPEQVLRTKVLERAFRAAHLDPTNEEAARLVVLGLDSPYWLRGNGRSSICYDRVIAEGQRYLGRFPKSSHAKTVRSKIVVLAYQRLTEMRAGGDWISLPYNPKIWRYAKVSLLVLDRDIRRRVEMNLWAHANVVGQCILMHCPPDRLEQERTYWRGYWKKNVEPLNAGARKTQTRPAARRLDAPTWDYVELYYYIRKRDTSALRDHLNELARSYPRSHQYVWWGTRIWQGQPVWKRRVRTLLKAGGDPEWKTWKPSFAGETFDWSPQAYGTFLAKFNPSMPHAWDAQDARPLPTDRITLESDHLATVADRYKGFRPLLSAGGYMWLCQPAPGEDLTTRRNLLLAPMDSLQAGGKELRVKARTIAWPAYRSDGPKDVPGQAVRCWVTTVEDKAPAVWIGTAWHGLARFDFKNGKWRGRWYTAKEGVPGEDILLVRPCIHKGKPKLLILSQPAGSRRARQEVDKFLWVLDPSTGQITSIAGSSKWPTYWSTFTKAPKYLGLLAVWKDGAKVPLRLYSRDDYPKLDVSGIVRLERLDRVYTLARGKGSTRVWGMGGDGLTQFDARMSPQRLLDAAPIRDDVYGYPWENPDIIRGGTWSYGRNRFYLASSHHYPVWKVLRAPVLDVQSCTGAPAILWGKLGTWREARGSGMLAAYRPASKTPLDQNDAWYGPWRTDRGIRSLDFIDGYLWLVTSVGNLHRFKPAAAIQAAQARGAVRSTAQWRLEYRKRLDSSWLNAVRMEVTGKEYDKALATIDAARRVTKAGTRSATPPCHLALWEALVRARKGDLAIADRLYVQLADDPKAEVLARGLALVNLVNVRHAAKNWSGLDQALDKLVAMFPGLNAPNHFSCAKTIEWYRQEARRNRSPRTAPAGQ